MNLSGQPDYISSDGVTLPFGIPGIYALNDSISGTQYVISGTNIDVTSTDGTIVVSANIPGGVGIGYLNNDSSGTQYIAGTNSIGVNTFGGTTFINAQPILDQIGTKSDITFVGSSLSTKADITLLGALLGTKADLSFVGSSLGTKADTVYVNSSLGTKVEVTTFLADLGTKADISYVNALIGTTTAGSAIKAINNQSQGTQFIVGSSLDVQSVGGVHTISLGSSGITAGTYGDVTNVGQIVVDKFGRIVFAKNVSIAGGSGGGTGIISLNSLTTLSQNFLATNIDIASIGSNHTFSIYPIAGSNVNISSTNGTHVISATDQIKYINDISAGTLYITAGSNTSIGAAPGTIVVSAVDQLKSFNGDTTPAQFLVGANNIVINSTSGTSTVDAQLIGSSLGTKADTVSLGTKLDSILGTAWLGTKVDFANLGTIATLSNLGTTVTTINTQGQQAQFILGSNLDIQSITGTHTISLGSSGAIAGTYGASGNNVYPIIGVDTFGRITTVTQGTATGGGGTSVSGTGFPQGYMDMGSVAIANGTAIVVDHCFCKDRSNLLDITIPTSGTIVLNSGTSENGVLQYKPTPNIYITWVAPTKVVYTSGGTSLSPYWQAEDVLHGVAGESMKIVALSSSTSALIETINTSSGGTLSNNGTWGGGKYNVSPNTFYYLYAYTTGTGNNGYFLTTRSIVSGDTVPTSGLPASLDNIRQLPYALLSDKAGKLIKGVHSPETNTVVYDTLSDIINGTGDNIISTSNSSTSFGTLVGTMGFPKNSSLGLIGIRHVGAGYVYNRLASSSYGTVGNIVVGGGGDTLVTKIPTPLNPGRSVCFRTNSGSFDVWANGFVITDLD